VARTTLEGNIRLRVAPEVSSLDFASGVQIGGFNVPALLSRRAQTTVELRSGQTLAIAGLLDNNLQKTNSRVPFLGDIPLIGFLFRHREVTANRTELLVLVTPRIVTPLDVAPPVPTGEPETFQVIPGITNP
jgi:pilus assembly protein CpaC